MKGPSSTRATNRGSHGERVAHGFHRGISVSSVKAIPLLVGSTGMGQNLTREELHNFDFSTADENQITKIHRLWKVRYGRYVLADVGATIRLLPLGEMGTKV